MLNKILMYGTAIGIVLSFIGYLIINTISTSEGFGLFYDNLYKLTLVFSGLFILTISEFISRKFNKIIRIIGLIFLAIIGLNIISELNIYKFNDLGGIIYLLFSSLYFFYLKFFVQKQVKTKLSYLKIIFLTLLFINGFLNHIDSSIMLIELTTKIIFWIIILAQLKTEYTKMNRKYVG
jgi:hypothetical protein